MGVVDVDVHVSSRLKEELAWGVDKRLWIISTKMLVIKTVRLLRSYVKGTKHFKFKTILYTMLCGP